MVKPALMSARAQMKRGIVGGKFLFELLARAETHRPKVRYFTLLLSDNLGA